ncbi:unnamed protein product [Orchesella dallaii]|uniref:Girdin n=1 Tax=Orchesella dallaii TaxID=48710 RepID=A0ABP1Q1A0_9HEXA
MDQAKEFLQSLQKNASTTVPGSEGDDTWKMEYDKLKKEFELYKKWIETETQSELSGMEMRWSNLQTEAETMKLTLETQNQKLSRQNTVLERQVTALQEELEETRLVSHEQMKHTTTMKRQLKERCTDLELKLEEKNKTISELTLQFTESKSRNERMYKDMLLLSEENEKLIAQNSDARQQYNENLNDFAAQCNTMLDKVTSYYSDELKTAALNYVDVSEQLDMNKELVSGMREEIKLKEQELQNTVTVLKERNAISLKTNEVVRRLEELEKRNDSTVHSKEEAQQLLNDVMRTVNELNKWLMDHQNNSCTDFCDCALAMLGQRETVPYYFLHDFESIRIKEINPGNIQQAARDIIEVFKREGLNQKFILNSLNNWTKRSEEKMEQLQARISVLEKSAKEEMSKHSEEMDKVLEKSKKYKKLIQKLRQKLKDTAAQLPDFGYREINSVQHKKERCKKRPKCTRSLSVHVDAGEKPYQKKKVVPVRKSRSSSSSSESCQRENRTSAQVSTCSEYKIILDNADCILKRIDSRTSQFVKTNKEHQPCHSHSSSSQKMNPSIEL